MTHFARFEWRRVGQLRGAEGASRVLPSLERFSAHFLYVRGHLENTFRADPRHLLIGAHVTCEVFRRRIVNSPRIRAAATVLDTCLKWREQFALEERVRRLERALGVR